MQELFWIVVLSAVVVGCIYSPSYRHVCGRAFLALFKLAGVLLMVGLLFGGRHDELTD